VTWKGMLNEDENFGESNIALFLVMICKKSFVDGQQSFNYVYLK
jgi:hypothetical protein